MQDSIRPIAPGVWECSIPNRIAGVPFGTRMTIVQCSGGKLLLHSPVRWSAQLQTRLDALGKVQFLVAPNLFHHMHLEGWQKVYPDAQTFGPPGLKEKRPKLRWDGIIDRRSRTPWQDLLQHDMVMGIPKLSELVFFHKESRTLIATDLLFNMRASNMGWWASIIMK